MLSRYAPERNVTWSSVTMNPLTKERSLQRLTGHALLLLREANYTIKVFENLFASLKRTSMSRNKALKLKMDLFKEYAHPKPFPTDMFLRLPYGSPDQAYVMLGQKGTGRTEYKEQDKSLLTFS